MHSEYLIKENDFPLKKIRSRRYHEKTKTGADDADDQTLLKKYISQSRIPTA